MAVDVADKVVVHGGMILLGKGVEPNNPFSRRSSPEITAPEIRRRVTQFAACSLSTTPTRRMFFGIGDVALFQHSQLLARHRKKPFTVGVLDSATVSQLVIRHHPVYAACQQKQEQAGIDELPNTLDIHHSRRLRAPGLRACHRARSSSGFARQLLCHRRHGADPRWRSS